MPAARENARREIAPPASASSLLLVFVFVVRRAACDFFRGAAPWRGDEDAIGDAVRAIAVHRGASRPAGLPLDGLARACPSPFRTERTLHHVAETGGPSMETQLALAGDGQTNWLTAGPLCPRAAARAPHRQRRNRVLSGHGRGSHSNDECVRRSYAELRAATRYAAVRVGRPALRVSAA